MPAAIPIDREAVRVLVVAVGVRAAAREMGIPEATVQAWSARGKWRPDEVREERRLAAAATAVQPHSGPSPADALANAMADLDKRTKLGFARASVKVAERLADAEPDALLDRATEAQQWAKTAALAHGWSGGVGATVNVAVALRMDMDW